MTMAIADEERIAVGLLELRQIKVANFLPSLVVAPVLAAVVHAFGAL